MRAQHSVHREEFTADEHVAIRLQRDRTNKPVRSSTWIETAVQTAIGIEAGNVVAIRAIDTGERTADENLAIRLQHDRINSAICSCAWIESAVPDSIGIKPGEASN